MTPVQTVDVLEKILPADEQCVFSKANTLNYFGNDPEDRRRAAYRDLAPAVLSALGRDADRALADVLTNPGSFEVHGSERHRSAVNRFATLFAAAHCQFNPTEYAAGRLIERLRWMMESAGADFESKHITIRSNQMDKCFLIPGPAMCLYILSAHVGLGETDTFLDELIDGKFDRHIEIEDCYTGSLYGAFFRNGGIIRRVYDRTLQRRHDRDALSYESFRKTMTAAPHVFDATRLFREHEGDDIDQDYLATYRAYGRRFLAETVDSLPETAGIYCKAFRGARPAGIHWIDRGLDKIREIGTTAKDLRREYEDETESLKRLISSRLAEGESDEQLIEMLKSHDETTLLLALPYASCVRPAILDALGWHDIVPVQNLLYGIAGGTPYETGSLADIPNGEDPGSGVLDRKQCLTIFEAADQKRLNRYLKIVRAWGGMRKTMTLIDAVRGENRDKVERALKKHGQIAIKALGLFPVIDDDDVRERYLQLKRIHKEVAKYGSERQANSRAAVQAGMRNLAQAAGYPDEVRMEWELESGLAESMAGLDDWHEIDQWRIRLELEGISATIRIEKKGKPLKSVPPKVRKSDYYQMLRENQEILRGQARRFRKSLENMMCSGESIDDELLSLLKTHPALRSMIKQLILVNADGEIGCYDEALASLSSPDGCTVAETLPLRIAHVYDLYQAGQLPDWQRHVVKRRMVQPFKQAFRELYVLTPAEKSAGASSTRFAGHVVDSAVASRLLQSRGWTQGVDSTAYSHKHCDRHDLSALIRFHGSSRFFTEEVKLTLDEVSFRRDGNAVALVEIDPRHFSETMRDTDLVAAVAQSDDGDGLGSVSAEVLGYRATVLEAVLAEIGLGRVKCKDRFAHVQGEKASYRVHLASAAVHIEPGNYLCIVPEGAARTDNLYLPFADTDKKMAEILSKVLLLLNDDQITDESILRQIQGAVDTIPA